MRAGEVLSSEVVSPIWLMLRADLEGAEGARPPGAGRTSILWSGRKAPKGGGSTRAGTSPAVFPKSAGLSARGPGLGLAIFAGLFAGVARDFLRCFAPRDPSLLASVKRGGFGLLAVAAASGDKESTPPEVLPALGAPVVGIPRLGVFLRFYGYDVTTVPSLGGVELPKSLPPLQHQQGLTVKGGPSGSTAGEWGSLVVSMHVNQVPGSACEMTSNAVMLVNLKVTPWFLTGPPQFASEGFGVVLGATPASTVSYHTRAGIRARRRGGGVFGHLASALPSPFGGDRLTIRFGGGRGESEAPTGTSPLSGSTRGDTRGPFSRVASRGGTSSGSSSRDGQPAHTFPFAPGIFGGGRRKAEA